MQSYISSLGLPKFMQHIPWRLRTRRQKAIIVTFYSLILILVSGIAGCMAFSLVYLNNSKYCRKMDSESTKVIDDGVTVLVTVMNNSLT